MSMMVETISIPGSATGIVGVVIMFDILSLNYIAKRDSVKSKQPWADDGSSGNPTRDFGWTG